MESESIRILIEKYWNCETSLEEEKVLRDFFKTGEVPDDLKKFKRLFLYFADRQSEKINDDFEDRLMYKIREKRPVGKQRYFSPLYKVAAAVILILSIFAINQWVGDANRQVKKVVTDTFEDPEKALEETKKVLYLVSEKFKMGKEEASKLSKFNKAEDVVKNTKYKEI